MTTELAAAKVPVVTMIDGTHAAVRNIPRTTRKVAGYVTGTPDIQWTDPDWHLFPYSGKVRIDQSAGTGVPFQSDVKDSETGAASTADLIAWARVRQTKNFASTFYMDISHLEADVIPAVAASNLNPALLFLWIADWNLNEAEAAAMIGTKHGGMECVAVQWASPTSNPDLQVPGAPAGTTLKSANLDVSAAAEWWHHAPTPPPPNWLRTANAGVASARVHLAAASTELERVAAILHAHGG